MAVLKYINTNPKTNIKKAKSTSLKLYHMDFQLICVCESQIIIQTTQRGNSFIAQPSNTNPKNMGLT